MAIKLKKQSLEKLFIDVLICAFLYSKMQRGFEMSDEIGGIWNYIQLLFLGLGTITFLIYFNKVKRVKSIQTWLLYSLFIFPSVLVSVSFSVKGIFYAGMAFYPAAVLILFFIIYWKDANSSDVLLKALFYLVCLQFSMFMLKYYDGMGARAMISNAYYPLCLLPIIVAKTKDIYKWFPMGVVAITILLSSKRAGLIAIIAGIFVYYMTQPMRGNRLIALFKRVVVLAIVATALLYLIIELDNHFSIGIIDRMTRITEDGGSGRDVRWRSVILAIKESNNLTLLFGHGYKTLYSAIGDAHNDFLQVLYESGIFALCAYIGYFIALISTFWKMCRKKFRLSAEFAMSIIFTTVMSLFSFYIIEPTFITCGMISQGYLLAEWEKEKRRCK